MPEHIRVKQDDTGHEFTIPATRLVEGLTPIDKPALGRDGTPALPTYRVPMGRKPASSARAGTSRKGKAAKAADTEPASGATGHPAEPMKEK